MMTGRINSRREAVLRLPLQNAAGEEQDIEVILDTGFSGSLTLSPAVIAALGLPFRSRGHAVLADGNRVQFDIHAVRVIWDGVPRGILVEAADTEPLVGMGLLYGHRLCLDAVDGGSVTIERLSGS